MSEDVHVPIESDADTVIARQAGRDAALRLGFTRTDATFVATAISEIARPLTSSPGVRVSLTVITANPRTWGEARRCCSTVFMIEG